MQLESLISNDPAVRRELERFELVQIWTADPQHEEIAKAFARRMQKEFGTQSTIPLHVITDEKGNQLERFEYRGAASSAADYLAFLKRGRDKFERLRRG